jgi:glycosyltransferase involved in cell wall biosynthesis
MKSCQIGLRWSTTASGGAERVFSELAAGLPEAGVGFFGVVAGSPDLVIETAGQVRSFAPEEAGTIGRLRGARKVLTEFLQAEKPDVLASHFAMYTFPVLDRLRAQPFVMHFHGPWALESGVEGGVGLSLFAKSWIERAVYSRADRCIVLSRAFAKLLHEKYGIDPEKIRVIPGAVDLDRFNILISRQEARDLLGWPNDRPILLSVRRLVHRMGLRQLIDALPSIQRRFPDVLLMLAGTGPLRSELEQRVRDLDLERNVRFLGFVPEELLSATYRAADVTVVPTLALEGFGLVAAESLAAGTPSMVTRVGGLPEVVQDLSEGLLFESNSPDDMADGLSAALSGRSRLPGETECRAYAEQRFSRGLMSSRVAEVYSECVSGRLDNRGFDGVA